MNFLLLKSGLRVLHEPRQGKDFLHDLASRGFPREQGISWTGKIAIASLGPGDYLGYNRLAGQEVRDLFFTQSFLKDLDLFVSPAFVRLLLALSEDDLRAGKRFREQGNMKSVLVPGTHQQKVLLFCSLENGSAGHRVHLLVGIGDAAPWNSHGESRSARNDFHRQACKRQEYYQKIYQRGIGLVLPTTPDFPLVPRVPLSRGRRRK